MGQDWLQEGIHHPYFLHVLPNRQQGYPPSLLQLFQSRCFFHRQTTRRRGGFLPIFTRVYTDMVNSVGQTRYPNQRPLSRLRRYRPNVRLSLLNRVSLLIPSQLSHGP